MHFEARARYYRLITLSPIMFSTPQTTFRDVEQGNNTGALFIASVPSKFTNLYKIDGGPARPAPNEESKEPSFGDSSGPFFSIYSKAAEDEDTEVIETSQKSAKAVLLFVSSCFDIHIVSCTNWNTSRVYSPLQSLRSLL